MSDINKLSALRVLVKEISTKLIYNIDEQSEILELIQRFETYQQALLNEILATNNNEAVIKLKDIIGNIHTSIASKDWVLLNHIIRNDFGSLEKSLPQ